MFTRKIDPNSFVRSVAEHSSMAITQCPHFQLYRTVEMIWQSLYLTVCFDLSLAVLVVLGWLKPLWNEGIIPWARAVFGSIVINWSRASTCSHGCLQYNNKELFISSLAEFFQYFQLMNTTKLHWNGGCWVEELHPSCILPVGSRKQLQTT